MLDLDETFVFDSITHAYNMAPSNYRNERHAEGIVGMLAGAAEAGQKGYKLSPEGFVRDWGVEETANMLFRESQTDMATFHPVPMYAFHDGLVANEKAVEVVRRWPDRFRSYASIDPLKDGWEEDLANQAEAFDPIGIKLYPSHWTEDHHEGWSMGDPEVAFPVFEKALDMGITRIDIHKAIPFGPVPRADYHPGDVDVAAESFPDVNFSIVHAGVAFAEETAWQLARFPNVYGNLEGLFPLLVANEYRFAEVFAELLSMTGEFGIDQLFYSSGAMAVHPRPQLEAFAEFQFPDEVTRKMGAGDIVPLTDEHKRKILGENYAEFIELDVEEARSRTEDDEFRREGDELAPPYSTTAAADEVVG